MTRPTTLLLIRHGETAWNAEGRIQGQLDVPLSARGVWQAGQLAQRLADESIDAVISSNLSRARLTAEPLAQALRLPVTVEPRLGERHFGRFQGHTADEIAARWPDDFQRWRQRDPDWPIPEGESGAIFGMRVLDALADLCVRHAGGCVAVIAHGGTLDVAYRAAMALTWDAPRRHVMLNASVNRVRAEGRPPRLQVIDWGDVAHLDGARDELAGG
jgi:probable phosphoglycerate mutase